MTRRTSLRARIALATIAVLGAAAQACGGAEAGSRGTTIAAQHSEVTTAPDVRGEPLRILPPGAMAYLRFDAARARRSPHFEAVMELARSQSADTFTQIERELGFDPLRAAQVVALGLYAPPLGGEGARPVLYARGGFSRDAVIAAARARAETEPGITERVENGVRVYVSPTRAYVFPAEDVAIVFDPGLVRRVLRQLSGQEPGSAWRDARFDNLWTEAGGREGAIQIAADLRALRSAGTQTTAPDGTDPAGSLDVGVVRAEADDALDVRIVATASSDAAARRVVESIDEVRNSLLRRIEVRLMGFGRLLNQGLTAVNEGPLLRVRVDATALEVRRLLGATRLIQAISQ